MDAEWLCLRAGVKPAIQRGAEGSAEALAIAARFVAEGFSVARSDPSTGRHIVYVAARQEDADALRDAEADLLLSEVSVDREAAALEEVGRRLGYPACCVARRVARNRATRKRKGDPAGDEDYRGAVDAWVEHPAWELNRFALPNDMFPITFEPCTYRCAAALALARRVLARFAGEGTAPRATYAERQTQWIFEAEAQRHEEGGEVEGVRSPLFLCASAFGVRSASEARGRVHPSRASAAHGDFVVTAPAGSGWHSPRSWPEILSTGACRSRCSTGAAYQAGGERQPEQAHDGGDERERRRDVRDRVVAPQALGAEVVAHAARLAVRAGERAQRLEARRFPRCGQRG
jgi:hypothetical protein